MHSKVRTANKTQEQHVRSICTGHVFLSRWPLQFRVKCWLTKLNLLDTAFIKGLLMVQAFWFRRYNSIDTRHLNLIIPTVTGLQVEANNYVYCLGNSLQSRFRNCNMIIKERNGVAAKLYGRQQLTHGHSMAHLNTDYRKNIGTYLPNTQVQRKFR